MFKEMLYLFLGKGLMSFVDNPFRSFLGMNMNIHSKNILKGYSNEL